jgi:S-adenosylmethionine:tRNA ribosyltransferase-isomerase
VPAETAAIVNRVRKNRRNVIAVGTTSVRALESAVDETGLVTAKQAWTSLVIQATSRLRVVTGLLTGFHEPTASHLSMLQALTGASHLRFAYHEAVRNRYLWHEFGDVHLILP